MGAFRTALGVTTEDDHEFFTDTGLKDVAKWAAGGFALLGGLLAFFGVKEGVLDHVLRRDTERVLYVFLLVGLGVLCGLFAPAVKDKVRVRTLAVSLPIGLLGLGAWWLGRHDPLSRRLGWFTLAGFAVLLVAAVVFWRVRMSLVAAVMVVGVAATSMGLYSAATIAVAAKISVPRPQIVATLEPTGVAVAVKALLKDEDDLLVWLHGHGTFPASRATGADLGQATLRPDLGGAVDTTVHFPVSANRWPWLTVSYCTSRDCGQTLRTATLGGRPAGGARVGAAITPEKDDVAVSVKVVDLAPGDEVVATVSGPQGTPYVAYLVGDKDGNAEWSPKVTGTKAGDVVTVSYACEPDCGGSHVVATYRV